MTVNLVLVTALLSLAVCGCGKSDAIDKKDVVAYINEEPISRAELWRDIDLRAKQDPAFKLTPDTESEQLELLINKKLIIQAAIKKGIAKKDNFVNTVKAFWDQTLIRDFIDSKKAEVKDSFSATEDEMKEYYGRLSQRPTFKVLGSRNKKYIDEAYDALMKDEESQMIPWQTIGPVGYEDIGLSVLLEAFDMDVGVIKKFDDVSNYYLVIIISKDVREPEPFDTLRDDIEKRVIATKERRFFEDWLKNQRRSAKLDLVKS